MLFSHHSMLSSTTAPSSTSCGVLVLELAWDGRLEEARRSLLSVSGFGMRVDAGVQLAVLEAFVEAGRLEEAGEILVELRRWGFEPETGVVQALIGTRGPSFRHFMEDSACFRDAGGAGFPRPILRRDASGAVYHIPWRTLTVAVDLVARALGDDGHLAGPAPPGEATPHLDLYRSALLSPATSSTSTAAPFQTKAKHLAEKQENARKHNEAAASKSKIEDIKHNAGVSTAPPPSVKIDNDDIPSAVIGGSFSSLVGIPEDLSFLEERRGRMPHGPKQSTWRRSKRTTISTMKRLPPNLKLRTSNKILESQPPHHLL